MTELPDLGFIESDPSMIDPAIESVCGETDVSEGDVEHFGASHPSLKRPFVVLQMLSDWSEPMPPSLVISGSATPLRESARFGVHLLLLQQLRR